MNARRGGQITQWLAQVEVLIRRDSENTVTLRTYEAPSPAQGMATKTHGPRR